MTLKELREQIALSPNKEWLQNYELEINYHNIDYKNTIKGASALYEFISNQENGFNKLSPLPAELGSIRNWLTKAKKDIVALVNQNNTSKNTWDNNFVYISGRYNSVGFLYDSPETNFLIKIYREKPELYPGAYEYLSGSTNNPTTKKYFEGYLLAYEFSSKDFSGIANRKDAEKKSIITTREQFQEKLTESEKELVDFISRVDQKYNEYLLKIDALKDDKENLFNKWYEDVSTKFKLFNANSLKNIKDLEELYHAKLKLEAPAKYWNERASKLRKEGYKWLIGFIITICTGVGILTWILNMIAAGKLTEVFASTATAIKWSIVLVTLISFIAYAIKIIAKLTFSSFHLVRDAEEREQLTYVYLSLQKEAKIDATERHLIMQSLFSRADSGLLKDDASPTMPGNIVDQMTKR